MPYNLDGNRLTTERKSLVLVIILFVDLILISSQIILGNKRSLLQTILANMITPLQLTIQKSSDFVSSELYRYVFLRNVYKKYQLLKKKQLDLKIENLALKKQIRELNLPRGVQGKFARYVTATTIAVDVNFPYSSIVIDKGRNAGLVENDVVLNRDAELVGKVVEPLTAFSASVRLITSSIGGTGAYVEGNMLEGLLKGSDGPDCHFRYLLSGKPVALGAQVVTSGTDLIYPNYLPLGRVTKIEPDYLTQKIVVRPHFVDKPLKKLVVLIHE